MRKVVFDEKAFEHLYSMGFENPRKMQKTLALTDIDSARRTPFSGIGKPELLKHNFSGHWSRAALTTNTASFVLFPMK
jgi:toxin YoeB